MKAWCHHTLDLQPGDVPDQRPTPVLAAKMGISGPPASCAKWHRIWWVRPGSYQRHGLAHLADWQYGLVMVNNGIIVVIHEDFNGPNHPKTSKNIHIPVLCVAAPWLWTEWCMVLCSAGLDGLHQAEELSIRIRQGCRIHHLVATLTRPGKQSQKTMGKMGKIHHFSLQ